MIARFIRRWASHIMASQRKDPKEAYRSKAIDMARSMGRDDLVARLER